MASHVVSKHLRPSAPSAEAPTKKQCRFKDTGYPTEWAEDYRPSGFHPVHLGDKFSNDRYRVVRKLGEGSFSTVWLAFDTKVSDYVALKIMSAKASKSADKELSIYDVIQRHADEDSLSQHMTLLLDTFEVTGPNGIHRILVFPAMGPSSASMLTVITGDCKPKLGHPPRYPTAMTKTILKHALSGLAFLHKNGIVHGDVQPGNLLFAISNLKSIDERHLIQDISKTTQSLKRKDGKIDEWGPRYLASSQSLAQFVDLSNPLTVKVSDLGAAFSQKQPPKATVTPVALRAPELILGEKFDRGIDIWAFGCLIYEFLTGSKLFSVHLMGDDKPEDADDDHILDLIDVLGPLRENLMAKWPRKDKWIGPNGERLQPENDSENDDDDDKSDYDEDDNESLAAEDTFIGNDDNDDNDNNHGEADSRANIESNEYDSDADNDNDNANADQDNQSPIDITEHGDGYEDEDEDKEDEIFRNDSLEVQFAKKKPQDIDEKEGEIILSLIRQILQYDSSKRPTAIELLEHPWFRD